MFDFFFFSSRRRHTRFDCDWSSDVCSSDLVRPVCGLTSMHTGTTGTTGMTGITDGADGMAFLDIEQVVFTYPGRPPVVDGVDWRVQAGEVHCLLGRSGCGKTTLLKLAAGLLRPQSGRILLRGAELAEPDR